MDINAEQFINGLVQVMGMNDPSELGNLFSNDHKPMNEMNDIQRTITNMFKIVSLIFKTNNNADTSNLSHDENKEQVGGAGIQGKQGVPGRQGPPGKDGKNGKDADSFFTMENYDAHVFEWNDKDISDDVCGRIVYMNGNGKIELINEDNKQNNPIGVVVKESKVVYGAFKVSENEQAKKYSWINKKGIERVSSRKPPKGTSFETIENKETVVDELFNKTTHAQVALCGVVSAKVQPNDKLDERWILLDENKLFVR